MIEQNAPSSGPSSEVLCAFGATLNATLLEGGQGRTFLAGNIASLGIERPDTVSSGIERPDIVLRPVDNEEEAMWVADVMAMVVEDGFRVPRPIRSSGGSWIVDGWTAWNRVDGEHRLQGGPWAEVVDVSIGFHRALAGMGVQRPSLLDRRDDLYSTADRFAFGEVHMEMPPPVAAIIDRLQSMRVPVQEPSQLIHGDLAGNLLFADMAPPAVIDFSPYWRPAGYATALTIVDVVLWYGAEPSLASLKAKQVTGLGQFLIRSLLFRLAVDGQLLLQPHGNERRVAQAQCDVDHAMPLIEWIDNSR